MKFLHVLFVALLSAAIAFSVSKYTAPIGSETAQKETAFERVVRTNTLRCAYVTFPPYLTKDPVSGAFSGLVVDMLDYFAKKTGVKIEWTEEVTFGNWVMALQSGRIDAVCATIWPDVSMGRVAQFTRPFYYIDLLPVVRADDTRFGDDITAFNDPSVTIGVLEGDSTDHTSRQKFPKAKFVSMPPHTDVSTLLASLADGKYDMLQSDRTSLHHYNQQNPGRLKALNVRQPIKVIPSQFVVGANETALAAWLNNLIADLIDNGVMESLLTKWQPAPGIYLRIAKPYVPAAMTEPAAPDIAATSTESKP